MGQEKLKINMLKLGKEITDILKILTYTILDEQLTIYGLADVCNSRNLYNVYVYKKKKKQTF